MCRLRRTTYLRNWRMSARLEKRWEGFSWKHATEHLRRQRSMLEQRAWSLATELCKFATSKEEAALIRQKQPLVSICRLSCISSWFARSCVPSLPIATMIIFRAAIEHRYRCRYLLYDIATLWGWHAPWDVTTIHTADRIPHSLVQMSRQQLRALSTLLVVHVKSNFGTLH